MWAIRRGDGDLGADASVQPSDPEGLKTGRKGPALVVDEVPDVDRIGAGGKIDEERRSRPIASENQALRPARREERVVRGSEFQVLLDEVVTERLAGCRGGRPSSR